MITGILLTLVALAGMVVWSFHEIRRVDRIIGSKPGDADGKPAEEKSD